MEQGVTRGQTALLAGFAALAPLAIDMYLPALTMIAGDLGVTVERAGQSVSIFLIGIALGQLVAGPLSDRIGRRPVFLGGLLLFFGAAVLAALANDFRVLLGARLVQALGACAAMVAGRAVVRDRFDATGSARFFSLLALIGGLAPILAPLLGTALLSLGDWRLAFWTMAGFAVLLFAGGLLVLPESRSDETAAQARGEHAFAAYGSLMSNRALRGYLLAAMFNSAAFFTYVANSSVILVDGYGLSARNFSLVFGVNSLALVGAAQLNRRLLATRTPDQILRLSARNAALLAVLLLLFGLTQIGGLVVLLILLFLMIGSISPVQANAMAGGLAVDALRGGSAAALFGAITFAGGAASSWIASLLYDGTARGLTMVVAACLAGAALSIWFVIGETRE